MSEHRTEQPCHVPREVFDTTKDQRDHWKQMYELAAAENQRLRNELRRVRGLLNRIDVEDILGD